MTPEQRDQYLALPERFRDTNHGLHLHESGQPAIIDHDLPLVIWDSLAETIAIASMLVALTELGYAVGKMIWHVESGKVIADEASMLDNCLVACRTIERDGQ